MESIAQKKEVHRRLLRWFERHGRDLPWRRTRDPYAILVSEIMLQQTQVPTAIRYYERFMGILPTVRQLAQVNLSQVLRLWEGLGYYSRARNLHRAAQQIVQQFEGLVPDTLEGLRRLPGIGRYTAGAVLSIAYNQEVAVLDGNVKRVISRLFAVPGDPREAETERRLWQISESLIPRGHAGAFNQALMDLGSMVCTPRAPQCLLCPLRDLCKAVATGNPEDYPRKTPKKPIPHREAVAAVIQKRGRVLLRQRPPEGLLGGLWEFPNWETASDQESDRDGKLKKWLKNHLRKELGLAIERPESLGVFRQTYSHFKLTLHAYCCETKMRGSGGSWVTLSRLGDHPMSRIHRRIAQAVASPRD